MTSKELAIHKRIHDASPMPRLSIPRGTAKGTTIFNYLMKIMTSYYNRPIYVKNPPIDIFERS